MKRGRTSVEELSDYEEGADQLDQGDESDDIESTTQSQPAVLSKRPKRDSTCLSHASDDVLTAVESVISLLSSPTDAITGLHMLIGWCKDATTAAVLCRLPALNQLHSLVKSNDQGSQEAQSVFAKIIQNHSDLGRVLFQTLGPKDFHFVLRSLPVVNQVQALAEHVPADLIVATLRDQASSPSIREMVVQLLLGLNDKLIQNTAMNVFASVRRSLVEQHVSLAALKHCLNLTDLDLAQATIRLVFGLLLLGEDALPGYSDLIDPISRLLFHPALQLMCLHVLMDAFSDSNPTCFGRTVVARVVGVFEQDLNNMQTDEMRCLAARILLQLFESHHSLPFTLLELVHPELLMRLLHQRTIYSCNANINSPLVSILLRITTLLLESTTSLKYQLLPLVPVTTLMTALRPAWYAHDAAACLTAYLAVADDVPQRLCKAEQVRRWFVMFLDCCQSSPNLAHLAAQVLRAGADGSKDIKPVLSEPASIERLCKLLSEPVADWQCHVIWMLRFASSGSERRKTAVFQYVAPHLNMLQLSFLPHQPACIHRELAAFYKSLTSLAGPRKSRIFNSLRLDQVSHLLRSEDESVQEHVAGLLRNLTHGDNNRKQAVYVAMQLEDVVRLLSSTSVRVLQSVTGLLQNLCTRNEPRRQAIFEQLPLDQIINLLHNPDIRVHAPTAGLLMNLCRSSRERKHTVLQALPLSLVSAFYHHGTPPPALADQAAGLTQHMRMAFLSVSRDQLHQLVRGDDGL
eukprot:TRINITY_DN9342_c0_g1_i1.p1 TRINITY_DN9342_c0_g1~~TRINITY_DN9342_c0_g1_i1.p1  ORF type:complete len:745 (+),score=109.20 TRINITY_DN9342_c0_g1_i1:53-2287(+)